MNLLVTGAAGFLGAYVVAEALRRGLRVRALVRPGTDDARLPWRGHPSLEVARLDLESGEGLGDALRGMDAVVHLAARMQGDVESQRRGTVAATENLLAAMRKHGPRRLVAASSIAVFDHRTPAPEAILDEDSPLEPDPGQRDAYAQAKLLQEAAVRHFGESADGRVTLLRLGVVYGRAHLWSGRIGVQLGDRLWLCIGNAPLPLVYVENCADAVLRAVEAEEAVGASLVVVDDDAPRKRDYVRMLRQRSTLCPRVIPLPWRLVDGLSAAAAGVDRLLGGRLPLPGLLRPPRIHARFKPLRYANDRAKATLGWRPVYALPAALDRIFGGSDLLATVGAAGSGGPSTSGSHANRLPHG